MKRISKIVFIILLGSGVFAQQKANNPLIYADVPDMSMIRVGDTYYMSSTTMHMSPGVPVMSSKDLTNWTLESYCYDTLVDNDAMNLDNGQSTYGRGSWASCIRFHNGEFMVSTFAATSGKTHIFTSKDIKGPWKEQTFKPAYHDHTIFFDDDGKVYMIYGAGKLKILELKPDLSGLMPGVEEKVLIENASAPAGDNIMLGAEGSQLFKVNDKYYLFNITWPRGGMRTVLIHRADKITGPWESRVALQDRGIAQGGLIDTPDGRWFSYLFRDNGGVGRIPYLTPVTWKDDWPVLGIDGKVPDELNMPANGSLIPELVNSDEFNRKKGDKDLPLVWQWNHNPDNSLWSVQERKGYLRLTTGRVDTSFVMAKNTLTQRTIGPESTGSTKLEVSGMKDGDFAGLCLLQKNYGLLGVKMESGQKFIVMESVAAGKEEARIPLTKKEVYFKAACDFKDRKDEAQFYYSFNGKAWTAIGAPMKMPYTLPHFMGYRFGLFNYATESSGGYADFDWFRISHSL
ncbi:glycoside hydrolase 43 family protein [Jiulongibacter sediminis]|mgnify:CR=1 FL=1|uniref:glycoside hydrolase family 43 protein n=1 Tax=Jiulongibacter sediminis TaxID=1605367 RepID=UPI0026EEAC70|nr:glycoside hydrolase 43 family protein [Jiulongibacter sediminis]